MKVLTISPDDDGVRLDRVLRKSLKTFPLSAVYRFIRKGKVRVNGQRVKESYRVHAGDVLEIDIQETAEAADRGHNAKKAAACVDTDFFRTNFKIIYEDEALLVCDKPAGIVVHSGTGHVKCDTLIDCAVRYMMQTSKKGAYQEPVLVHRLDRDTSGVILIAKNRQVLRTLHEGLRSHTIEKKYSALCHGKPPHRNGTVDCSLVRTHERNSGMKVAVRAGGVSSLSRYRVLKTGAGFTHIAIDLHTGRTHQIRVHMAHIGCPVIGDVRYGDRERDAAFFRGHPVPRRLYLHAEQVSFFHPVLDRKVSFTAPLPASFKKALQVR